jgi:hypothetical protein
VVAQLASLLLQEMPANAPTKDSTLAVEAKRVAAIPHPVSAKIPIPPFNPASSVVAIAAVINLLSGQEKIFIVSIHQFQCPSNKLIGKTDKQFYF